MCFVGTVQVDRREEPMGTFDCSQPEHSFTFKSAPVPTGWHVRGNYACTVEFVDDSGVRLRALFLWRRWKALPAFFSTPCHQLQVLWLIGRGLPRV